VPDGLLVEGNYVARNNTERFGTNCRASCAQAGMKLAHMNGVTIRDNVVEDNNGHGIWCDLDCSNGVIVDNVVRRNAKAGIFYEVSDTGIIASNVVVSNGGYGIRVAAANTKIYNNTVVDNTGSGGMWIYDDARSLGFGGWVDVGPDTTNVELANNIVSDSIGNDTLLRISIGGTGKTNTVPEQYFSVFDDNAYYRPTATGEKLVRWLSTTSANYLSLTTFNAAEGWDEHSVDITAGGDPFFTDTTQGDFAVRGDSPALGVGLQLPDDVAAAIGVPADAGQNLGALVYPGVPAEG
jgi:parallel beta-helix repeat protein